MRLFPIYLQFTRYGPMIWFRPHWITHSLTHSLTHSFTQQVFLKQQPGTIQGDRNTAVYNQSLYTCAHKAYVLEQGEKINN